MNDFIDAARRGADRFRQAVLADSEFVEKLCQVFSRMDRVDLGHGFILSGVTRAGEGLAAVHELVLSVADLWKDERLQRPDELVKTILANFS